jgi:deoxyribodipyrimidine photo-lyase
VAALAAGAGRNGKRGRSGADVWLSELVWREFYLAILFHHPRVLGSAFDERFRRLRHRRAPKDLAAWQEGRTGYPIVDAAMRQLATIGWMHNRARMIVASFLSKDLLIDWRLGEAWFMRQLVDGDPASNDGGWQWTAGTGTDAAPYFRVFNPVSQSKRFDPRGDYIRRWVPELRDVAGAAVHEPWKLPDGPPNGYPSPIVDHAAERLEALRRYDEVRAGGA